MKLTLKLPRVLQYTVSASYIPPMFHTAAKRLSEDLSLTMAPVLHSPCGIANVGIALSTRPSSVEAKGEFRPHEN